MRSKTLILLFLVCFGTSIAAAQTPKSVNVRVKETAGIRRSGYPVSARVPLPKGELKDVAHVRLMFGDREVPAQFAPQSRWPDNSVQSLDVDFNATVAPLEEQSYRVEYGEEIKASASARGLSVSETPDAVQIGNVRFNKKGAPLVLSVHYRQEDIGSGENGFVVTDNNGTVHDLLTSEGTMVEVVKPGPLLALVRYNGKATIDGGYSVPFTITAEMPNSKTWVKYSLSIEDPAKRLRDVGFNTPLSFGAFPWLWDFGTGSWTYGSFRNPTDSVILIQTVKANAPASNEWIVKSGPKGQETPYEVAAGSRARVAEGWGHFQDGKEVVAFGFDKFGRQPGTYTVAFNATGQASFRYAAAQPQTHHELTIYQHYVASPTPIGAVTSPVSMLNGLVVSVSK